ncbi:NAD-dependent epimerase/dehydratase family protein [Tardiphaga sp. 841_E9_N1_2]|jgi:UDP-glucose 4-epimerase|uniref:NAD-dependent epimerase/dehydratase family protein n=1 Tax=Tardiphaga sp. 841_E9_N1_2 TaxID=3240762 RepID=UPI003F21EE7A
MRCLVTGATGFIGRQLVCKLVQSGHDVLCLTRKPVRPKHESIDVVVGDLLDPHLADTLIRQPGQIDAVFHAGGILPFVETSDPGLFLEANGTATLRLLDRSQRAGVNRFVYFSSISVIGEPRFLPIGESHPTIPTDPYSLSKLAGELACGIYQNGPMSVASFRVTSPYGPGMRGHTVLPRLVEKALTLSSPGWYGPGMRSQDFVHVDDVVSASMLALRTDIRGVFNVASGRPISMRSLAESIASMVPGARASQIGDLDPQETRRWEIDISAARRIGFSPQVALGDGLKDYIRAIQDRREPMRWWH